MKRLSKILGKGRIEDLVSHLLKGFQVFGPVERRLDVSFQEISSAEKLKLDYITTTMPPKKFFHLRENIITYDEKGFRDPDPDFRKPVLLFGVHPCDLNAILRLDRIFSGEYVDPYYAKRRKNSAIVALTCNEVGPNCFCSSLKTGPSIREGFDLLLTDVGESYLVEVGTQNGEEMIRELDLPNATLSEMEKKEKAMEAALSKFEKKMRFDGLGSLASINDEHEVWAMIGDEGGLAGCFPCLSCGNCSMVCPTCYCYEVVDIPDLTLKAGVRRRELDSCQLLEYSEVALNGNFRPDRRIRVRHWMRCKFGAAGGQLDSSCVGCGRCIHACPAGIDLTEVANKIWEEP